MRPAKLFRAQPKPLVELDGHVEVATPVRITFPALPPGTLLKLILELDLKGSRTANKDYRLTYLARGPG